MFVQQQADNVRRIATHSTPEPTDMRCAGEPSAVRQHKASSRRELLTNTVAALSVVAVSKPLESAEALPFGLFEPKGPKLPPNTVLDRTLSYTFIYPLQTASGKEIPMVASRKPEKYSSAAPLVADARQRIVAEYVSLAQGITCSMFVGPVTGALQRIDQSDWTANDVAQVVLSDRSAVRPSLQCHHSLRLVHRFMSSAGSPASARVAIVLLHLGHLGLCAASIHVVLQNRNYAGQKLPVASVELSLIHI